MEKTTALILAIRKNTGNNIIIDCYTKEHGRAAFIYSFTKTNKGHKALLSPMNWINFSVPSAKHGKLQRLSDLSLYKIQHTIGQNPIKNLVVLFLSEIISSTIKEEHKDPEMFQFLEEALAYYDDLKENYADFHLSFLVGLAALLGIAPPVDTQHVKDEHYAFWESKMSRDEKENFRNICLTPLDQSQYLALKGVERTRQLNIILDYFQHFATGFRTPKSLALFREF